jgi:hypothetical protein
MNVRNRRTAVRFILNRTGNSKTEIPVESWLATTEREGKPKSQQSFIEDDWTELMAEAYQDLIVFVQRIPLRQEWRWRW